MTENENSPENLRKFLESDDPAMVQMGLSMAKGSGVPDDLLGEILWMYMMHDDKTIRAAAKSTFMKLAPEDAKQTVKNIWNPRYRRHLKRIEDNPDVELYDIDDRPAAIQMLAYEMIRNRNLHAENCPVGQARDTNISWIYKNCNCWLNSLGILGRALSQTSVSLVGPLIRVFENGSKTAALALGDIGSARAIEALFKSLEKDPGTIQPIDWSNNILDAVARILSQVEINEGLQLTDRQKTAFLVAVQDWERLVEWGEPAIEPLIKMLNNKSQPTRMRVTDALLEIENVKGLKIALRDKNQFVRNTAKEALKKLGHEVDE